MDADATAEQTLTIRPDGLLTHNGIAVGRLDGTTLVLNAGWCRLAGLSIAVQNDPDVDRNRSGLILDRPA